MAFGRKVMRLDLDVLQKAPAQTCGHPATAMLLRNEIAEFQLLDYLDRITPIDVEVNDPEGINFFFRESFRHPEILNQTIGGFKP
jgi:hypothetical protein